MPELHASKRRYDGCHASGFSLFELIVCLIVISLLAAILLNRLGYYQEMAEKAAMDSTLRLIKTGLQIRLAELIVTNRQGEAARLEIEDPLQWLDKKPPNYGGRYYEPPAAGTWYFDSNVRELVYVVNAGSRLDIGTGSGPKQVRFRARLVRTRLQIFGTWVEGVAGVTLSPVKPYRWQ